VSRAKTAEEVRAEFLDCLRSNISYWATREGMPEREKLEGLTFSFLTLLDGVSGMPCFDLLIRPHSDDKQFHIDEGQDYYEDGMIINDCYLHDEL